LHIMLKFGFEVNYTNIPISCSLTGGLWQVVMIKAELAEESCASIDCIRLSLIEVIKEWRTNDHP
jgi:hypothetical protein